jgi:hypothetical protein
MLNSSIGDLLTLAMLSHRPCLATAYQISSTVRCAASLEIAPTELLIAYTVSSWASVLRHRRSEMGLILLILLVLLLFGGGGYGYSRYGYGGGIGIGGILLIVLIVYLLFGYGRF